MHANQVSLGSEICSAPRNLVDIPHKFFQSQSSRETQGAQAHAYSHFMTVKNGRVSVIRTSNLIRTHYRCCKRPIHRIVDCRDCYTDAHQAFVLDLESHRKSQYLLLMPARVHRVRWYKTCYHYCRDDRSGRTDHIPPFLILQPRGRCYEPYRDLNTQRLDFAQCWQQTRRN